MRAIHFIATISVVGTVFFAGFIAEPPRGAATHASDVAARIDARIGRIGWISLVAAVLSGTGWLVFLAEEISGLPMAAVLAGGPLWSVLTQTDFGQLWVARFVLAMLLAGALLSGRRLPWHYSRRMNAIAALLAASLVGTLAWAGHAGAEFELNPKGILHLFGDTLHLIAGAAWVGALVPLALLLGPALDKDEGSLRIARSATSRFSTIGVLSVVALVVTGVINGWALVGSVRALTATNYGHLLLVKVMLFFVMLSIAAVNRLRLTPNLLQRVDTVSARDAAVQLRRNAIIEAAIGVIILTIVAVLGTMVPGVDEDGDA